MGVADAVYAGGKLLSCVTSMTSEQDLVVVVDLINVGFTEVVPRARSCSYTTTSTSDSDQNIEVIINL